MYVEIHVGPVDSIGVFPPLAVAWVVQFRAILGSKKCKVNASDRHTKLDVRGIQAFCVSNTQRRVCFSETLGFDNPSPVSILTLWPINVCVSTRKTERERERVGIHLVQTVVNDVSIWMITTEKKNTCREREWKSDNDVQSKAR